MSSPGEERSGATSSSNSSTTTTQKKYKGIRCRKWGKWVSEIRVPGTQDRLWLGSYSTPEGAAVAHDVAFFCLRGPPPPGSSWDDNFNFPHLLPITSLKTNMSPGEIQKAASDAGMAIDASQSMHENRTNHRYGGAQEKHIMEGNEGLSISVEDYL